MTRTDWSSAASMYAALCTPHGLLISIEAIRL